MILNFVPAPLAMVFALILLALSVTLTLVLRHHWVRYSYNEAVMRKAQTVYLVGSAVLLALILLGAFMYLIFS